MSFPWTAETIALAQRMDSEGKSRREIGALLGCTRNVVTGRMHRLRIAAGHVVEKRKFVANVATKTVGRAEPSLPPLEAKQPRARTNPVPRRKPPRLLPAVVVTDASRPPCSLLDLDRHGCKFAVTGHDVRDHLFCNQLQASGSMWPYCESHLRVAINPRQP